MIIGALKENKKDENRVALTPESAQLLSKLGHKCLIEKGAGTGAGFADAEYVSDDTFVTQGLSHHCMEPRTTLAYWQNGKCFVHASSQSQSFPVPFLAGYIGIEPKDLVFIAEYCGGGFGSKGTAYTEQAIPAHLSKKIGRPVMMRISRAEEYFVGCARPGFQGRIKMGFDEKGRILALDLYIVQENGPDTGFNDYYFRAHIEVVLR